MDKLKIGVISLGCDKNRVDTEKMLSFISKKYNLTSDPTIADVVIINTCAFLRSAREEAISEILAVNQLKEIGTLKKLIVTGCLPQKFIKDIFDDLTEVDAFLGVSDYDKICDVIDGVMKGERINAVGLPRGECGTDRVLTTSGYAYLKIADGCSNHCTYCLIPKIRGAYRSVKKDDLIREAKSLGDVNELILVAQDVACYGKDLDEKITITDLVRELSILDNVKGIRLMYCYPENITDDLIEEIATNEKVIKYIDIPFQHADDLVLKRMNRKGTGKGYLELIDKLKNKVKGIAIRSTFITGFPGETENQFLTLKSFIEKAGLFNAGFFAYSKEEDTPAFRLDGHLLEKIKKSRQRKLYTAQKKVVRKTLTALVGNVVEVVAEGFSDEYLMYYGRAYFNAPDVDGKVYFFSAEEVAINSKINVKITDTKDYDLYGERL